MLSQRDRAQGLGMFCADRAQPPRQMVMSCIDANAKELGSEPICRELAVALSPDHKHAGRLADPAKRSSSALRAGEIRKQNVWVHEASPPPFPAPLIDTTRLKPDRKVSERIAARLRPPSISVVQRPET